MGYVSSQDGTVKVSGSKFMQRSTLPSPSAMTSHDLPNHEIPHRFLGKTAKSARWLDPFSSPPKKSYSAFIERNLDNDLDSRQLGLR